MSDRRQELERKKQKLALIREEKEKRRREKAREVLILNLNSFNSTFVFVCVYLSQSYLIYYNFCESNIYLFLILLITKNIFLIQITFSFDYILYTF